MSKQDIIDEIKSMEGIEDDHDFICAINDDSDYYHYVRLQGELDGYKMAEIDQIRQGCGDEFISEDGDFTLMCGKHIWKKPGEVSQYNLCQGCQSFLDALVATGEGEKE